MLSKLLSVEMAASNIGFPNCYKNNTFWVYPESSYHSQHVFEKKNTIPKPSPLKLYKPRVFIWIPHLLVPDRKIDYPTCPMTLKSKHLQAQGWATTPFARRICNLTNNFYVMSYRYKCPRCFNEKGQPGTTFAGHDQDLMKKSLPESLVLEFPTILTHRSAIYNDMVDMMRIREELQKLQEKNNTHSITKYISTTAKHQFQKTFSAAFNDKNQYVGFIPSFKYLSKCFEEFVKIHRQEYNIHTATQPATVLTVDHCYKTCKHIFKLENTKIFEGLLTMTNEFNEIRVLQFVPISSMDYIKRSSYALHNTNNSKNEVLEAINVIAEDKENTVGFDSEWTYNRTTPAWYPTATIQIAYNDINSNVNRVIIIQLSKFKSLLQMLISFLSNANIKKVGRCINQDISHFNASYRSDKDAFEAQNIVDIGNF
ncbi:hypothetical protein BDC45DRAFT_533566 [Circinella umbellata]|nr:hypothetical protein BDC45DRAFT_533566 [Circinella umbellata]